jgi:hypothetical protein
MKRLVARGKLLSLPQMMALDVRTIGNRDLVTVYYIQAVSLVGFMITEYGPNRFTSFCRQLRDGKTIEDSLRFAYPISIRSIEELDGKWKQYIMEGQGNGQ